MAKNVGFRFHPTNEELVNHYLKNKIFDRDFSVSRIKELDIYKFEPWDLPLEFPSQSKDKMWYCYCLPISYANGKTTSRKTRAGYWKITAKDRDIKTKSDDKSGCKKVIGVKKTLTFYKRSKESKRGKGSKTKEIKTEWVMHEYHYRDIPVDKKSYVLCRIKIKSNNHRASTNKDSSSQPLASNIGSEVLGNPHLEVGPSLVAQSDILNDVIEIQQDFSSADQSLNLSQSVAFNNMYVNTSSPGEVQSSDHSLASNFENDGSSHFLSQVDPFSFRGLLDSQFFPLQNFTSNYDECQRSLASYCGDHAAENNSVEGVPSADGGLEACDGYNGLNHNVFPAQQPLIRTELKSSNVVGFTANHSPNSHFENQIFENQIEQVDDLTIPPWSLFGQDPVDIDPPSIDSSYTKNTVYIGDNSNIDTEITSPWVKEYPPQDFGEYYYVNPPSFSIWDCSYDHN